MLVLLCICGAVFRAPLLFWGRARLDSIVCVVCPPEFFGAVLFGVCVCLVFSLFHIELNHCLPHAHRPNITVVTRFLVHQGCGSILRLVRAASVHYPRLWSFVCELYTARRLSTQVQNIDAALSNADLQKLMDMTDLNVAKWACSLASMDVDPSAHSSTTDGLQNVEGNLKIKHAQLITNFEKLENDDPEHACCSCERLCLRKNVTSLKNSEHKFNSETWND